MKNINYKKFLFLSLAFLIFCLSTNLKSQTNDLSNIRNQAHTQADESLILFHFNLVECVKCVLEPNAIIENLILNKNIGKIRIVGAVICDRNIELKAFKKQQNWNYDLIRNDGTLFNKLKTNFESFVSIITPSNKVLNLKHGIAEKNYYKIVDFIINNK